MKITQNTIILIAVGALVGIVAYKNIAGKKDKNIDYNAKPTF